MARRGRELPSLPADLEAKFHALETLFPTLRPPARAAAIHAVRHLRKAWALRNADPEMAIFRAITAEEEAATALLRSLKRIGYVGAEQLRPRSHPHKAGVWPMLLGAVNTIAAMKPPFHAAFRVEGKGAGARHVLYLRFIDGSGAPVLLPNGKSFLVKSEFPLEVTLDVGDGEDSAKRPDDFSAALRDLARQAGRARIEERIRDRANLRNQILYAGETAYPEVRRDVTPLLEAFATSTRAVLFALLLVDPYDVPQRFAQQVLDVYLRVLASLRRG